MQSARYRSGCPRLAAPLLSPRKTILLESRDRSLLGRFTNPKLPASRSRRKTSRAMPPRPPFSPILPSFLFPSHEHARNDTPRSSSHVNSERVFDETGSEFAHGTKSGKSEHACVHCTWRRWRERGVLSNEDYSIAINEQATSPWSACSTV